MIRTTITAAALLVALTAPALAGPKCTGNGEKLAESKVQEMYKAQGYEIQRWKISSGGCYEIYGRLQCKKIETYIDPWTGAKLEEHQG